MKSSEMRTVILQLLVVVIPVSGGCLKQMVQQSGPQTMERGSSVKLNCSVSKEAKKPTLIWIKIDENGAESKIYPSDGSSDTAPFHVDPDAFQTWLLLSDLKGRDSGRYLCSVTFLQDGEQKECRGEGTDLTVRATMYDIVIACCPLGVFITALLVLHGMVYHQWMEYRKVHNRMGNTLKLRMWRIHIPRVSCDFIDFLSML